VNAAVQQPASAAVDQTSRTSDLVRLRGIGKNFPIIGSTAGRLKTVGDLLLGRAIKDYFCALEDISLVIKPGESWGIIGENGAGKSTLLKIIAGVAKATAGEKSVSGRVNALLELGTGFHPEYTGRENIFLASSLMGWSNAETRAALGGILAFADIDAHIDQPVKTYSSGMVVRLGFAIATVLKPDLLVTDEVLAVGDESFQKKCLRWMEGYLASGGTLLLCSHSMYHIQRLCQKAIWIHHGRDHMQGDVHKVTQAYLAYHEEKNREAEQAMPPPSMAAPYATMLQLATLGVDDTVRTSYRMGDAIVVNGVYQSPDDKPTVLMVGVMRIDGTPVFGTFSNGRTLRGTRIAAGQFSFTFVIMNNPLLPGKYKVKAHTLDEHGLRLFDTMETEITIEGETQDHGLVRLEHEWRDGRIGRQHES
jgi:lipopolysaccharide transport system ATP-binding protein